MAAVDLDRLCFRLSSIQADQLYCLDDGSTVLIPKIRGMSVADAIATIRTSISDIPDVNQRLECVCEIYARLMANRAIGPWVLYHVAGARCEAGDALLDRFLQEIDLKNVPAESLAITEERIHACVLVPESDSPSTGHEVYFFTFWTSSPCVAVYRPPEGYSDGVRQILGSILGGDPKNFERGEYFDQDAAYHVAMALAPPRNSSQNGGER
ncbi:hypothetical protein MTO96_026531 [Rhipicephalus appendiculatus]